jgi:hypothetical protein
MIEHTEICPRCKLVSPSCDIPPKNVLATSNGCWAKYGEILAREYSDPACMVIHHLTVDAYFAQHVAFEPSALAIASQNTHVIALYLNRCKGYDGAAMRAARAVIAKKAPVLGTWIEPPTDLSATNISELLAVTDAQDHLRLVESWTAAVWKAWEVRAPEIEKLVRAYQC